MKFGFIGAGNMAGAMIRGTLKQGVAKESLLVCDHSFEKAQATGAQALLDAVAVTEQADAVVLAVKPYAAQGGIYLVLILAALFGFNGGQAASISIIAGADGPTAIFLTKTLAPEILAPIAVQSIAIPPSI